MNSRSSIAKPAQESYNTFRSLSQRQSTNSQSYDSEYSKVKSTVQLRQQSINNTTITNEASSNHEDFARNSESFQTNESNGHNLGDQQRTSTLVKSESKTNSNSNLLVATRDTSGEIQRATPANVIPSSYPTTTTGRKVSVCTIDINISIGPGGQPIVRANAASSRSSPMQTRATIDNVHTIDIDLTSPQYTAQIETDGTMRVLTPKS